MNKNRLLIIEDEPPIANAFKKQLTMLGGFSVDIANGGNEGLEKLKKGTYDLVLLDIVMPDIDGIDVLRAIQADKKTYKDVPVMMLTNVTAIEAKKEVEKLGVKGFVVKTSIRPDELIERVKEVIA